MDRRRGLQRVGEPPAEGPPQFGRKVGDGCVDDHERQCIEKRPDRRGLRGFDAGQDPARVMADT